MVAHGSFPLRRGGKLRPICGRRSDVAAVGRGLGPDLGPEFVGGHSARYPSSRWPAGTFRAPDTSRRRRILFSYGSHVMGRVNDTISNVNSAFRNLLLLV